MTDHISLGVKEISKQEVAFHWTGQTLKESKNRSELLQAVYLRAIAQKGDWFYDPDFGLPHIPHDKSPLGRGVAFLGMRPRMPFGLMEVLIRDEMSKELRINTLTVDAEWKKEAVRQTLAEMTFSAIDAVTFGEETGTVTI